MREFENVKLDRKLDWISNSRNYFVIVGKIVRIPENLEFLTS